MRIVASNLFYCGEATAKLPNQQIMSLVTLKSILLGFFFKAQTQDFNEIKLYIPFL